MIKSEFEVDINGLTLRGIKNTNDTGGVWLALHGWQDTAASLAPVCDALKVPYYAFDFAGHGKSDWRHPSASYYLVEYVKDIALAITKLDLTHIHLIGHSMGGMVSMALAALLPERIQSLVLIESLGFVTTADDAVITQLQQHIKNVQKPSYSRKRYSNQADIITKRARLSKLPYSLSEQILSRALNFEQGAYYVSTDPRVTHASPMRLTPLQADAIYQAIRCPVCHLYGDSGFDTFQNESKANLFIATQVVENRIKGGHHCHLDAPEQTVDAINAWLKNNRLAKVNG